MPQKLSEAERGEGTELGTLLGGGWAMVPGRDAITKTFMFKDFVEAWSWMSGVAVVSERHGHHPEWFNVYNKVEVTWSTHDCGGLSSNDLKLATLCDQAFKKQQA